MLNHFGYKGLALGVVLGAGLWALAGAGAVLAADNEVRLPIEKTVRLTPLPETPTAKAAKAVEARKPEKNAEPAPAALKTEAPKAELPKADTKKPETPKAAASKPEAKKPEAAKADVAEAAEAKPAPVRKAVAKVPAPEPKPAPKPKPEPKPKPAPVIDPLALEIPAQPQPGEAIALPEGGQFMGAVELEFLADRIILRGATNSLVERVTHFGLTAPRKLALDLRGSWRKKGGTVLRFDTGPVKAVVAGEHPDRLRLALEFREGAVAPDMQPTVELGPRGITVTIPLAVRLKR